MPETSLNTTAKMIKIAQENITFCITLYDAFLQGNSIQNVVKAKEEVMYISRYVGRCVYAAPTHEAAITLLHLDTQLHV